jgi:malate dehydrogenase
MKVTVVGAGNYGSTLAKKLAEHDMADEVVMFDIVGGLPQGLALDMNQARPVERYRTRVVGTDDYRDTSGSEVVVITAGSPRKPGMSRMDLLEINAKIVKQVTEQVMEHSAEPVLVVVTNPLDEMTTLAADVSALPRGKVMGQAGMLDSARFAYFISEATGADILEVDALTLGSHGETMVPVPSQCRVGGKPLTDVLDGSQIADLVERTREGGGEIVGLLKKGSAYFAPAAAAAAMVQAVLQGSDQVMPVCAWTTGEYGIADVYLGVPARLGTRGVEEIIELPLQEDELRALREAAEAVRGKVGELGEVRLG